MEWFNTLTGKIFSDEEIEQYIEEWFPEEYVDDLIDEKDSPIEIIGLKYSASRILKEIDPIAYKEIVNECWESIRIDCRELLEKDYDSGTNLNDVLKNVLPFSCDRLKDFTAM